MILEIVYRRSWFKIKWCHACPILAKHVVMRRMHPSASQDCWSSKNCPSKTITKNHLVWVYWYPILGRIPMSLLSFSGSLPSQGKTLPSTMIFLQIGMFNCHLWLPKGTFWEYPWPSQGFPSRWVEYLKMLVAIPSLVPLGRHQHRRATAAGVLRKHSHESHTRFTGPRLVLGAWVMGHPGWVNTALMCLAIGQLATVMNEVLDVVPVGLPCWLSVATRILTVWGLRRPRQRRWPHLWVCTELLWEKMQELSIFWWELYKVVSLNQSNTVHISFASRWMTLLGNSCHFPCIGIYHKPNTDPLPTSSGRFQWCRDTKRWRLSHGGAWWFLHQICGISSREPLQKPIHWYGGDLSDRQLEVWGLRTSTRSTQDQDDDDDEDDDDDDDGDDDDHDHDDHDDHDDHWFPVQSTYSYICIYIYIYIHTAGCSYVFFFFK